MGRTLPEIMDMPCGEFNAWRAYWRISPFGDYRNDLNSGIIASTMANIHRGKKSRAFTSGDFMPSFELVSQDPIEQKINEFMKTYH